MTTRSASYTTFYPLGVGATWLQTGNALNSSPAPIPVGECYYTLPNQPYRPDSSYLFFLNPPAASLYTLRGVLVSPRYSNKFDYTWIEAGNNFPPIVVGKPFVQTVWQLPAQPTRVDATWIEAGNNFPPTVVVSNKPFNQYDWPLAQRPVRDYSYAFESFTQLKYPVGIVAITPVDWPLPVQPRRPDVTWINNNTVGLFSGPVVVPFNQDDWPNPRDARDYRSYIYNAPPGIIPAQPMGFNQYSWPNPVAPYRLDQTFTQSTPALARTVPVGVFSTSTWKWNFRDNVGSTWYNVNTQPPTVFNLPKNQYYWPLPIPRFRLDATWINQVPQLTPVPPPPPTPQSSGIYRSKWLEEYEKLQRETRQDIKAAAAVLSKLGGHARAAALTSKQRSNIASNAAKARWNKR